MEELRGCPFCGIPAKIVVCDDEGNWHEEEGYEQNPWSGLGYQLDHNTDDAPKCPIAAHPGENTGVYIYDTREDAIAAWNKRATPFRSMKDQPIFDGDILLNNDTGERLTVFWCDVCGKWMYEGQGMPDELYSLVKDGVTYACEVVGNVHEGERE